ncbi:hypothetical protein SFRURICE_016794 [Spodoptera frugiperda]|nr:hypothetical protein SFRURICE_016794 [Spodoptera frugiperda]
MQRHAFYTRGGRQRCTCTLWHLMPLYITHPSHLKEIFKKPEQGPSLKHLLEDSHFYMQRHALYSRKGRQGCTLRHVMPLYNVHPLFTIYVISPIHRATTEKFLKNRKKRSNICPTRESNPRPLVRQPLNRRSGQVHIFGFEYHEF